MTQARKRPRLLRLLPGVALASAALLVLNGAGLFHDAAAWAQTAATALNDAPAPANPDYAGSDDEIATAAQADILTSLSRRRAQLDARENNLKTEADILAATEQRVDAKIAQLKGLQDKIAALMAQRDDAQKAQITALVKTYGPDSMKPAAAAAIFNTMPDSVLIPVAQAMKPGDLGQILSKMAPDAAQKLTVKLADRLALPDTTDALAPQAAAAAPPGVTASAAPVPAAAPAPAAAPQN